MRRSCELKASSRGVGLSQLQFLTLTTRGRPPLTSVFLFLLPRFSLSKHCQQVKGHMSEM